MANTLSTFDPFGTTTAVFVGVGEAVGLTVAVPVSLAVGVMVINRKPVEATLVANTESVLDPYGMITAVFVDVAVCVSVGVAVAVAVGDSVLVGVDVCMMMPLPAAMVAKAGSTTVPCGITTAVFVMLAVGVCDGV